MRAKYQRNDYTIPVRLDQHPPPRSRFQARTSTKRLREQVSMINNQISSRSSMGRTRMMVLVGIATAIFIATLIGTKICHCDKTMQTAAVARPSMADKIARGQRLAVGEKLSNGVSGHKERLLSSISNSIERQHLQSILAVPINGATSSKSFIMHQRPSKFDSGEETLQDDNFLASENADLRVKSGLPLVPKVVDESMRHILRMHENNLSPNSVSASKPSAKENQQTGEKWRQLSRAPVRVISNLIKPNAMASQILSYISPLVSSKKGSSSSSEPKQPVELPITVAAISNNGSRFKTSLQQFVGRSNTRPASSSLLFNVNRLTNNQPQPVATASPNLNSDIFTMVPQQTSWLSRPQLAMDDLAKDKFSTPSMQATATTPFNRVHTKQAVDSVDLHSMQSFDNQRPDSSSPPKDLMAAESSPTEIIASVAKLATKSSPETAGVARLLSQPAWLKNGVNQFAQDYIQDSFRGLLTLSQLPILSANQQISTAPSVLERGGKLKPTTGGGKLSGKPANQTTFSKQALRAIDELYRYAYILGTGVRRKRDPLTALGTSLPSTVSTSSAESSTPSSLFSSLSSSKTRGILSQRSINQLMAANRDQLLSYARGLNTLLTMSSSKKAKPRGVMWDMATDPSLAVTVFHLLDRASVALPLGFLLLPFVKMIRNPLNGFNLAGRLLPTHRSVDYEILTKQLDMADKILSRALRPTHREAFLGK